MKSRPKTHSLLLIMVATLVSCASRAQDVAIVANPDVQIAEIASADLRDIFIGARSSFRDHSRAVPVLLKGGPAHEVFLHNYVGETPESFRALWRKAVFTGQGVPPREFISEAALLQYVSETPGAIGYVSRVNSDVKVKILTVSRNSR